jgi:chemotaxis protein CheZ
MSATETEDLEALFDEIAAQSVHGGATSAPTVEPAPAASSGEEDLEALFDQVAAQAAVQSTPVAQAGAEDLEALFDQVAQQAAVSHETAEANESVASSAAAALDVPSGEPPAPQEVFQRIGSLTRNLHDALRELGYDKAVEDAVSSLPDARDRLSYIADLTGKAANRALTAVEQGQQYQNEVEAAATRLAEQWERVFSGELPMDEFKRTAVETRAFLKDLPRQTAQTNAQFTEIMMAQDFHDLTGQVIQRIVKVAQNLEAQLVKLLLETTPPEKRPASEGEWLTGPAMNATKRDDVVTGQQQVDELLESLGF